MTTLRTTVHGVHGHTIASASGATCTRTNRQAWFSDTRPLPGSPAGEHLRVEMRFDDRHGNGHATFTIGADLLDHTGTIGGGCMPTEIAAAFPELAHLLPWHLCSTDGPLHYPANAVYLAGDRDHNGLLAGERQQIRRAGKVPMWERVTVDATGAVVEPPERYVASEACPESDLRVAYVPWCRVGEGKERQLDAARRSAIWPDATDEQLCLPAPELRALLEARLPDLLRDFRAAMEAAGFRWPEGVNDGH